MRVFACPGFVFWLGAGLGCSLSPQGRTVSAAQPMKQLSAPLSFIQDTAASFSPQQGGFALAMSLRFFDALRGALSGYIRALRPTR